MLGKIIIICVLFVIVNSSKILVVVPVPSISHQIVFRPLIKELINRNHEVVLVTADPMFPQGKAPKNLKEIDLHNLSYTSWNKVYNSVAKDDHTDLLSIMTVVFHTAHEIFKTQLQNKSVLEIIRDSAMKFDLLILEECIVPTLIFSQIFDAPIIAMSSFGDNRNSRNAIGMLTHPLLYPHHFHQKIYNLTFWEKIYELYNHMALNWMLEKLENHDDRTLRSIFGYDTPMLNELRNNIHMLFLNEHPIWVHNQPISSNFLYIWGIHKAPENIISKELQTYLDSSRNGFIYVSFGTNFKTSSLHPEILKVLLEVFSQLSYNVLLKWDTDEPPNISKNMKLSKWFPQSDILKHPNLKFFITQGGLQSTQEAIDAGVPLIGIPIFGDQEHITEKYLHFKIGVKLHMESLTVEKLENAISTILKNYNRYKQNIIHLRTQMLDQPKPALENAIWWIEYVMRHGGVRHLRVPAANMSWAEYYEVELVLVVLIVSLFVGAVMLLTLYLCFKSMYLLYIVHVGTTCWFR